MRLTIVIPVLDEGARIAATLCSLQGERMHGHEIIVVDGGSRDDTIAQATPFADQVIRAPRGRARQLHAGAAAAGGDVLLFLHADTALPLHAVDRIVAGLASGRRHWGRFDVAIAGRSRMLPVVAAFMNWRSRLTGIATGDQAIFVRRETLRVAGGVPQLPLMEDVALSKALKRTGPPLCIDDRVVTSGRRWDRDGVWRTILLMWWLRFAYFVGVSPARLVEWYYGPRSTQ